MEKTTNYQLNKPEAGDPMRVADFNENADKIDAALNTLNTAMAAKGNCSIACGTYTGKGTYGSSSKNTLTFSFPPKVVGIVADICGMNVSGAIFLAGQAKSGGIGSVGSASAALNLILSWSGNSVTWYDGSNYADASRQLNSSSVKYHYFALG